MRKGVRQSKQQNARNGLVSEKHCLELLDANLDSGDIFVDIGSCAGYYSLYAHEIVGRFGQVHLFEPNNTVFPTLINNLSRHSMTNDPSVNVYKMAVSDVDAYRPFRSDYYAEASKLLPEGSPLSTKHEYLVETTRLDSIITVANFVKIDAEGEELRIINGMSKLIENHHPQLLIEIHHDQNVHLSDLVKFLSHYNYQIIDAKTRGYLVETGNIYTRTKHIFAY